MHSGEKWATSEILKFTGVPGSQFMSVVPCHPYESTVKIKMENQTKIQYSVLPV